MTERSTGKSRGFGFVTFHSPDSVDKVFKVYSTTGFVIKGKAVRDYIFITITIFWNLPFIDSVTFIIVHHYHINKFPLLFLF